MERNADVVTMTSYAPLLSKRGRTQWRPDLIYFDNQTVTLTPDYYVQQMYGANPGNTYLPAAVSLKEQCCGHCDGKNTTGVTDDVTSRFGVSTVVDDATGDTIVRLANMLPVAVEVNLEGYPMGEADVTTLTGSPRQKDARPMTSSIRLDGKLAVAPYSFTVVRIHA